VQVHSARWPQARLIVKDESAHGTGSLKHRLALSLVEHAVCSGHIGPGTPLIDASSGSTALSEAYLAQLLGLPFHAIVPAATSQQKLERIREFGGICHLVSGDVDITAAARSLAAELGGWFLDQFGSASAVTDWRSMSGIAGETFDQLRGTSWAEPDWFVMGAGTGGTTAAYGRHVRAIGAQTQVLLVDPEGSCYADAYEGVDALAGDYRPSRIEGIGRPSASPSFHPQLIDRALRVPDAASVAACRFAWRLLGKRVGGSTGTNLWGATVLLREAAARNEAADVLTLICDSGDRYQDQYFDDAWVREQGLDIEPFTRALEDFWLAQTDDPSHDEELS